MVATDIAARGLDIDSITHVINYDMPDTAHDARQQGRRPSGRPAFTPTSYTKNRLAPRRR